MWGGNGYQYDHFYERCDENGLLLWHDAPFTGKPQPTDDAFLALVRTETRYQARRLVGHPSLALLSSNNEQVGLCYNSSLASCVAIHLELCYAASRTGARTRRCSSAR